MVDYTNVITIESAQGIVSRTPNSSQVQRTTGGTLTGVTTNYFNASSVDTNGFDIEMSYGLDTAIGVIDLNLVEFELSFNLVSIALIKSSNE